MLLSNYNTKINMKKQNGNESLLALVLSSKRPEFRAILEKLEPHLKGMDNSKNPEKWNHLEFDFEHIHKVDVYRRFAPIFEKKYLMVKKKDFARHLALHSNLADNENYETRVETIYHGLKLYKKIFS
jgi:hypothetical protein